MKPPEDIEAISDTVAERVASEQPEDAGASDKALPEPTEEQLLEYLRLGEKGDGTLFAYLFHGQLICCEDMGDMWFQFDGTCWKASSYCSIVNTGIGSIGELKTIYRT